MPVKYKLMRKNYPEGDKLFSCSALKETTLEYHPDNWTTAKVGGILVFNTLQDVAKYMCDDTFGIYTVWEVSCVRPVKLPPKRLFLTKDLEEVKVIFSGGEVPGNTDLLGWPSGTSAYKSVRLLRPVQPVNLNDDKGDNL